MITYLDGRRSLLCDGCFGRLTLKDSNPKDVVIRGRLHFHNPTCAGRYREPVKRTSVERQP